MVDPAVRLTSFAAGGGCACKVPAGDLRTLVAGLSGQPFDQLLVGLDDADDAAVVRIDGDRAVISTADFFSPVVDDPFDWGRIAAANALSDVYAMGGVPVLAINLLAWPTDLLSLDLAAEVLRGGQAVAAAAGVPIGGGHTITAPEPLYGMAVTGLCDPEHLIRVDAAAPGLPISLTKPLGTGILNAQHRATGTANPAAVQLMATLNDRAGAAAVAAGIRAGTDVTGFGLLGHLLSMMRASGVGAVLDTAAVPLIDGVREALRQGHVPGGSRRNLQWVRPRLDVGAGVGEDDLLLLADAQTSGGLLLIGEVPGGTVVGHTVAVASGGESRITLR